jgi:asparagine synthase (glutamine-hydrolysing)
VDTAALQRMEAALAHRGPDARGYLLHRPGGDLAVADRLGSPALAGPGPATVGLAHRRLSIIDLSTDNDQPLLDSSGRYGLSYNGEVYNYLELRDELTALGHDFRTEGDTEVVLNSYKQWGPDCVQRFVGMWALALVDLERSKLLLSRDRFGIKPLFYSVAGGALRFASEIKALVADGGIELRPNLDAVRQFLLIGRGDASDRSFFDGIYHLPAAHNALVDLADPASVRPVQYWTPPSEGATVALDDPAGEFGARLRDSIRLHLRSDVPVGTCLSGGLDSSAIVCVADDLRCRTELPSFAHLGFGYVPRDGSYSERPYMEQVVNATKLEMTYVDASPDRLVEIIPEIARQQDEPFGTASIVAQWLVFEAARKAQLKVMLDGQGADEVLGGYLAYLPMVARTQLRRWQLLRYARFAADNRRIHGSAPLAWPDAVASAVPALRRVRDLRSPALTPAAAILRPAWREDWHRADEGALEPRSINEILSRATKLHLPTLLRFEDRNSMAHSIESRVPFLDHRLVEYAFSLPGEYKIQGGTTKRVLREAMVGTLPPAVGGRRDKVGFRPDPGITWRFAAAHADSLRRSETEYEDQWFDQAALNRMLDAGDRSPPAEEVVWRAISTKLWLRNNFGPELVA